MLAGLNAYQGSGIAAKFGLLITGGAQNLGVVFWIHSQ
jgi:hypothetical protein